MPGILSFLGLDMHPSREYVLALSLLLLFTTISPARADNPPVVSAEVLQQQLQVKVGHPLVLVYWASWCIPCRHFKEKLAALRSFYPEEQLHMLGVALDNDLQRVTNYLAQHPLPYPTVIADKALRAAKKDMPVPTTVLYRRDGSEERRLVGDVTEARLNHYVRRILQSEALSQ